MLSELRLIPRARVREARTRLTHADPAVALREVQEDYYALCDRRTLRIPNGRIHQIHCPRCRVFKRSLSDDCTRCGWSPHNGWGH